MIEVAKISYVRQGNSVIGIAYDKHNSVIVSATARCHPEDEFDFCYGAALAQTRLIAEIARVKRQAKFRAVRCLEDGFVALTKGKIYYIENDIVIGDDGKPAYGTKAYGFKELFEPITSVAELLTEGMWGISYFSYFNCYNLFCVLSDGSVIFDDGGFSTVSRFSPACSDIASSFKILALFKSTTVGGFNKRKDDIIYHYNNIKFYYGDFDALKPYIEQKKKEDELW